MAIPAANPLFKHFRQPSVYLKLPSQGRFWPEHALDIPVTGEIPVYPMTVKDELTIKTPDALMNGSGVADVIQSCCPNIKDPWAIPTIDLDAILISIRTASYGESMDIDTDCPNCGEGNTYAIDLRILIDNLPIPRFDPVIIDNLTFRFKPQTFKELNSNNIIQYEQQKLVNTITDSNLTEEQKLAEFQKVFPRLTDLNVMSLVNSIESITVDGTQVSSIEHIKEFINNCDRRVFNEIKAEIDQILTDSKIKPFDIQCTSCSHEYKSEVLFEQSNFFE